MEPRTFQSTSRTVRGFSLHEWGRSEIPACVHSSACQPARYKALPVLQREKLHHQTYCWDSHFIPESVDICLLKFIIKGDTLWDNGAVNNTWTVTTDQTCSSLTAASIISPCLYYLSSKVYYWKWMHINEESVPLSWQKDILLQSR